MFCKNCGSAVEGNNDLCDKCILKTHLERKAKKRRAVKKWIVAVLLTVVVGVGVYVIGDSYGAKKATESEKKSHDKSYMHTGAYERAKRNLGSVGYIIKDEEVIENDFDGDGEIERIYYYIDGPYAYIEINGEEKFWTEISGKLDDYLIILPVGGNMIGFILSCNKMTPYSKLVGFYDDEAIESFIYEYQSVAKGNVHVEVIDGEYVINRHGWYDEQIFVDGEIYSRSR